MAAVSSIIAGVALVIGAASTASSINSAKQQRRANERIQSEQRAANAAESARELRSQVREQRVRRARILQSAENTGASDSSGELGAVGALATNLSSNIGTNLGRIQTADNISIFSQQAANAGTNAQIAGSIAGLSMSIFSASGGFGAGNNPPPSNGTFEINPSAYTGTS